MVNQVDKVNHDCSHIRKELHQCYNEHPIRRFTGFCSPIMKELSRCVNRKQNINRKENVKKSLNRQKKVTDTPSSSENKKD